MEAAQKEKQKRKDETIMIIIIIIITTTSASKRYIRFLIARISHLATQKQELMWLQASLGLDFIANFYHMFLMNRIRKQYLI
jgi:carbon starvation protein CstA